MSKGLFGLFEKRWKFQKAALSESAEELRNPVRGWYQIYSFQVEEPFAEEKLLGCVGGADVLALVFLDIGAYRDRDLDPQALSNIRAILKYFAERPMDMILRIAYDHLGKAQEREPFFFQQVLGHLDQLGPVLSEFAGHIFVYQGALVGNWGEMHTSRFLSTDNLEQISSALVGFLGQQSFLAVRRPMYWRALHPMYCQSREYSGTRMGLFDDAIFGSATHLGTFGVKPEVEMGWDDPWLPEEEIAFEEKLCQYVPQGGEVVYAQETAGSLTFQETVECLRRMRLTYLNRVHDERLLNRWKEMPSRGNGPWAGVSAYDYIGRHLGYRFVVKSVSVKFEKMEDIACKWEISIENTGFARCYQEAEVWLEWTDSGGRVCTKEVEIKLDRIQPGETGVGACVTLPAESSVYLYARRKKDEMPLYFANETNGKRGVLMGRLTQS